MHNLRRFYYSNKNKIWKVVLIVAFLLGTIYFLDNTAIERKNKKEIYTQPDKLIYENDETQTYIKDKSATTGSIVTETEVKKINETISRFLQYCKTNNIQEAYNMLSTDCIEKEYNSLEKFKEKYVNKKFSSIDVYEIQNWGGNTYKIDIYDDMLITGEIDYKRKIEYITIVNENGQSKLNINGYIGGMPIEKEFQDNNLQIKVISKKSYMDYEIYDFKIKNLSDKTIKMDTLQKIGTMYLEDYNGNKYNAYAHEIFDSNIEIRPKEEINISITYANPYSKRVTIKNIIFKNIILDYVQYENTENKAHYNRFYEVTINI